MSRIEKQSSEHKDLHASDPFSCAGCSACYVGETNRHLARRVREHLSSDKNSHIFQHINGSEARKKYAASLIITDYASP